MKFPVKAEVVVYFSDCDPMGHCNNARFFTYMEHARVQYCKKLMALDLRSMNARSAFGFILAEATCTFVSPAYIDETLVVGLSVSEIGTKSFILKYEIREKQSRRVVALGRTVQVMYDYRKKKTLPVPASLRHRIEKVEKRKF